MKKLYLLIPTLLFASFLSAQPTIEWQKAFGGNGYDDGY